MAQLRQDKAKFNESGAVVLILGPDGPNAFRKYWEENDIPFIGLPDLRSRVAALYEQEVNLFKFGRMPALFVIDLEGIIRYAHYGDSMEDIPANEVILDVLEQLKVEIK
jgi:peroxiredoxin Q/BCP